MVALEEEWLNCRLRLCELTACSESLAGPEQSSNEVILKSQSGPQPAYNKCSILSCLMAYSQTLERGSGRCPPPDQHTLEPAYLQKYAHSLAEALLQSVRRNWESPPTVHGGLAQCVSSPGLTDRQGGSWRGSGQDELAEGLARELLHAALREVPGVTCAGSGLWEGHVDVRVEGEVQDGRQVCASARLGRVADSPSGFVRSPTGEVLWRSCSHLAPTGHPSNSSIQYPDAPPTSPLLPEMSNSRESFSRKLKEELAKEFLPSPPPPTPRDSEEGPVAGDDFVARLMRSLSLECKQREFRTMAIMQGGSLTTDCVQKELPSGLSDYAAQLSTEILHWVITSVPVSPKHPVEVMIPPETRTPPQGSHLLQSAAEKWTQEVLRASLLEVIAGERAPSGADSLELVERQAICLTGMQDHEAPGVSHCSGLVQQMVDGLCSRILAQAIHTVAMKSRARLPPKVQHRGHRLRHPKAAEHSYSQGLVWSAVQETARHRLRQSSERLPVRMQLARGSHDPTLQGMLLWAAASRAGTPTLQLVVPDQQLQTQFCSVARKAQLIGWTVGDLVRTLLCHSELGEVTDNGSSWAEPLNITP